jgi:integrase
VRDALINARLLPVLGRVPVDERFGPVVGVSNLRHSWDTFVRSTPWPWMTAHLMRHTYVTLLLRAGVKPLAVAGLVGDTLAMISQHYAHHIVDDQVEEMINRRFREAA